MFYRVKKRYIVVVILLVLFLFVLLKTTNHKEQEANIREPVVAGNWYPGTKHILAKTVDDYLASAQKLGINDSIKALISPHAGYAYSWGVASKGFAQLEKNYDKVIIIGTNHASNAHVQGISVPLYTHYKTPLGEVKVSEITKELLNNPLFTNEPEAHQTHIIEMQLPFLQRKLTDFEIIPLVTGLLTPNQIKEAADILSAYIDDNTLIIISSDLSHYHSYDEASELDAECIQDIKSLNLKEAARCEACGVYGISILLELAQRKEWHAEFIEYQNSGDVSADKSNVVGYTSIVFSGEKEQLLTKTERQFLLTLARQTLETYLTERKKPVIDEEELTPSLKKAQGCFTTLNKHDILRGCIGHTLPQDKLYRCVIDNTVNAAVNDRRFSPITYEDLDDIEIEISVLTVPEKLDFTSGEDLKNKLDSMVDGVLLRKAWHQSTYLPQVWEQLPDKEEFLSSLCVKGGMPLTCWQDTSTEVSTYQAYIFEE